MNWILYTNQTCPACGLDSAGLHRWDCPNNPDNSQVVFHGPQYPTKREQELEAENAMLRAEIGRLKEALWYYENHVSWD